MKRRQLPGSAPSPGAHRLRQNSGNVPKWGKGSMSGHRTAVQPRSEPESYCAHFSVALHSLGEIPIACGERSGLNYQRTHEEADVAEHRLGTSETKTRRLVMRITFRRRDQP